MTSETVAYLLIASITLAGILRAWVEKKPLIFWFTSTVSLIMLLATLAHEYQLIKSSEIVAYILISSIVPAGLLRAWIEGKSLIFWVSASASLVMLLATLAVKFELVAMPILELVLIATLLALSLVLTAALRASKLQ